VSKSKTAISCVNVSKIFSVDREQRVWRILLGSGRRIKGAQVEALRDITLAVPRGKIVGILGKNGAGKSTLLRLLAGIYSPTTGRIDVNGQVAGLFELGGMGNPNLSGREYAERYLTFMGVEGKSLPTVLDEICEFSELGPAFEQRIRTYSSGMAARLYFAVATAYQHDIYLIDELLSVGDEHFQAKCWRRMRDRLSNGASGILVTHDWTAIIKLTETACVIEDGKFSFQGQSDRAVVHYLNLPKPHATVGRFGPAMPDVFVLRSAETGRLEIPIVLDEDIPTLCAIAIEILRIGIGWEIVILTDFHFVADRAGHYTMAFEFPQVPLPPGRYSLNLFLRRAGSNKGPQIGLDSRTWAQGTGLTLLVEGSDCRAVVTLPFEVKRLEVEPI
jgi:lipopolysaccharide transport system ATP-binding protein